LYKSWSLVRDADEWQ